MTPDPTPPANPPPERRDVVGEILPGFFHRFTLYLACLMLAAAFAVIAYFYTEAVLLEIKGEMPWQQRDS